MIHIDPNSTLTLVLGAAMLLVALLGLIRKIIELTGKEPCAGTQAPDTI